MRIVVAVRCYNESRHIDRFMQGYDFADAIVVSDGGSEDDSVSKLKQYSKVKLFHFTERETRHGYTWNPDAPHMNFVLEKAKELEPDWLIFDDMDCIPNQALRNHARLIIGTAVGYQLNVFRLYLWGDTGKFFPQMNDNFNPKYTSLWAWRPDKVNIYADLSVRHGTLKGLHENPQNVDLPMSLLHKSWYPETINEKVLRYNKLGLPMKHPLEFAGELAPLPDWAKE